LSSFVIIRFAARRHGNRGLALGERDMSRVPGMMIISAVETNGNKDHGTLEKSKTKKELLWNHWRNLTASKRRAARRSQPGSWRFQAVSRFDIAAKQRTGRLLFTGLCLLRAQQRTLAQGHRHFCS
jgi:hypothetical protein